MTSSRNADDLWTKALNNFKAEDKVVLKSPQTDRLEILEEVLQLVQGAEQKCQEKKWKWKNRKGELVIVRDLFAKMVFWIEKFRSIGDNIVQYDPGHAALPWAAARFVLQAAINDVQTNGAMLQGLEFVFNLIARYEVVERLYLQRTSSLHNRLLDAIVKLYTAVLQFLLQAHRYYTQKTVARIAKSLIQLEETTTQYLATIKSKQTDVDEHVRLLSGEILSNTNSAVDALGQESRSLRDALKALEDPVSRIATSLSKIQDNLNEEQRLRVFEWLSTVQYMSHHRAKSKNVLPGSGQWLLRKPEFMEWMESSTSSILWLHGIPGSGKSMLVAHVVDYFQTRSSSERCPAPLAYFYCVRNTNEPERADPEELLRSILEQLSSSDQDLPIREPVAQAYLLRRKEARGRKLERLGLDETVEIILELLDTNPATIVIDGLDECDPARRQDLLNALQTIIKVSNNVVKVFVSSRDDHDLVHRLSQTPNLYIRASDNKEDIERFVKSRVNESIKKEKLLCGIVSDSLRDIIVGTLIEKARGMFRLVSLHIESLCDPHQIKTEANVLEALKHLPQDLKKSYDTVLTQITNSQDPNPKLAERTLKWLLCGQQALDSQGFIFAVCADMPPDQPLLSRSDILSICCNLVVYDEETDEFRFAHLSVQEYLEDLDGFSWPEANSLAAELCLFWVMQTHGVVRRTAASILESPDLYWMVKGKESFDHHADTYWPEYARLSAEMRKRGRLKTQLQSFLLCPVATLPSGNQQFVAWVNRLIAHRRHSHFEIFGLNDCVSSPPDPIFVTCAFNLFEVVSDIIQSRFSLPEFQTRTLLATNSYDINCAQIAARNSSVETIRVLLNVSQKLQLRKGYWNDVLVRAARRYHFDAMKAILEAVGESFVNENDIKEFSRRAVGYEVLDYEQVLNIFFENNKELKVTENVLEGAFLNAYHGPSMVRQLLEFTDEVSISMKLFRVTENDEVRGRPLMSEILCSKNTLRIDAEVVQAILTADYDVWISQLLRRKEKISLDQKGRAQLVMLYDRPNKFYQSVLRKEISEFLAREDPRISVALPFGADLALKYMERISASQGKGDIELTWEELVVAKKMERGKDYIMLLLKMKPKMDQSAVNMLVSQWDEVVVQELLTFRTVEITDEIIKAAAGNLASGEKIISLLLEEEAMLAQIAEGEDELA